MLKVISHLVGVVLQLVVWLQVEYHVQRLPVLGHLLVESGQVELVLDVVLVHLAEELVAAEAAEPGDPAHLLRAAHLGARRETIKDQQPEAWRGRRGRKKRMMVLVVVVVLAGFFLFFSFFLAGLLALLWEAEMPEN